MIKDSYLSKRLAVVWHIYASQHVTIVTRTGETMTGVSAQNLHILFLQKREEPVDTKDMFIDIGATSKRGVEVEIVPGDMVVPLF